MSRIFGIWGTILFCCFPVSAQPPVAEVVPVTDTYFGIPIVDPYRYMEDLSDPRTQAWMKGQTDYARSVLDALPERAALLRDIARYVDAAPARVGDVSRLSAERYFLRKTLAGQNIGKLYVRQGLGGKDQLLVDTDRFTGPHGQPPAINYYAPSFDGRYVAYGVSLGGSEMATIHILQVDTAKDLAETIDRAQFGNVRWRPDNRSFFYNRLQKPFPNMPEAQKYQNSKIYLHELGTSPENDPAILGVGLCPRVPVAPADIPVVATMPGSAWAFGVVHHGAKRERTMYAAPLASISGPDVPWVKICDVDDQVEDWDVKGDDLYLLTHRDAPRFKLIHTSLSHPDLANAAVVVPQGQGVLKDVEVAADAIYVTELDAGVYHILRVGKSINRLPLPFDGTAGILSADPRVSGVVLGLTGWTKARRILEYDPTSDQVVATDLQPTGLYDNPDDLTSLEVTAPSYDGTPIPLSIVYKTGIRLDGTNPTAVYAYGGYGVNVDPGFGAGSLAWLERGGIFAWAHCRGGGEEGEPWHQAAMKLTKPNVWRDLISCCGYLIRNKYTSPSCLAIYGGSNGGVVIGRAVTERPDLFAAAYIKSGLVNPLRFEFEPNGPFSIPEFGSVATQEGFEDLYAMDAYQHVREGVRYPAILQTSGINDPRVPPVEPAKFTARLQAASASGKPILLSIDYQGGHGVGATKAQVNEETADWLAFFLSSFSRNSPSATQK